MDQKQTEFIKECTELEQLLLPHVEGKQGNVVAAVFCGLLLHLTFQTKNPEQTFKQTLEILNENFKQRENEESTLQPSLD